MPGGMVCGGGQSGKLVAKMCVARVLLGQVGIMNNNLPTNAAQLVGLGFKMYTGIVQLGAAIPITMVTAAEMQTDVDAFSGLEADFNAARSARLKASLTFQDAMGPVYEWLLGVSNTLATRFGTRWSTEWAQAGFINNSTAIPSKLEDRLGLTLSLVKFFTKNPGYEVPTLKQTAAEGEALRSVALKAQTAVADVEVALNEIGTKWTSAYETLTAAMRALIKNLEGKLAKDDPRWLNFGLNMPAAKSTPGQPVNVSAHTDETGAIVVQCEAVPLAKRYRWRMLLVGVETEYKLALSTTEPMGAISGVVPGQPVEIIVQAVNGDKQGVASEPIVFTLPGAKGVAAPKRQKVEEAPEAESSNGHENGNGKGNGTLRHSRVA